MTLHGQRLKKGSMPIRLGLFVGIIIALSPKLVLAPDRPFQQEFAIMPDFSTEIPYGYEDYLPVVYRPLATPYNYNKVAYQSRTSIGANSKQGKLQSKALVDERGYTRIGDYYLVAMGTRWGAVGDTFRITLEQGGTTKQYLVMLGDIKSDAHTDPTHTFSLPDGSMIEYIVDMDIFVHRNLDDFRGRVVLVEKEIWK